MARGNNNGWDFVEVGKTYLLIESGVYSLATVLDNYSTPEYYYFKMRFEKSTDSLSQPILEISHQKNYSGGYSGMVSIFELEDYPFFSDIIWKWEFNNYKIDYKFDVFKELLNDPNKADFIFESCLNPDFFKNVKLQHNSLMNAFLHFFRNKQISNPSIVSYVFKLEPGKIRVGLENPVIEFLFIQSKNSTIEFALECPVLGIGARNDLFNRPLLNCKLVYNDFGHKVLRKLLFLKNDKV